ncbi:hypothetical protein C1Y63_02915 [Corynebacterium sp. 13CS0277]|nr:hypothetical protein C1Y63_02915 [Corynebacterium sp. 13CS0277]
MLSMQLPAICEQNPGRMIRGRLETSALKDPGGAVTILTSDPRAVYRKDDASASTAQLAEQIRGYVIDVDRDGTFEYVVAMQCWRGGVDWPEQLFLVDQDLHLVTNPGSRTSGWRPAALRRAPFKELSVTPAGTVRLGFASHAPQDPDCCPSRYTRGEYRFRGADLVPVGTESTTPR